MTFSRVVRRSVLAAVLAVPATQAFATVTNYVQNGSFELTSGSYASYQMSTTNVPDWTFASSSNSSYSFIMNASTASSTGAYQAANTYLKLWGPGDGSNNGLTASPDGGNFLVQDPVYQSNAIQQTITGLTAGAKYTLTFYWAGAQQSGYTGDTTEGWLVTFGGNQTYDTGTITNTSEGFTGWQTATVTFTAGASSQVLSFLAEGTPSGVPPMALLDGVSLVAYVPEPATWTLMIAGLLGVAGFAARRRPSA